MAPKCGGVKGQVVPRYGAPMKWTVVATVDVPNLVPGEGAVEDSVLGMAAVAGAVGGELPQGGELSLRKIHSAKTSRTRSPLA